MYCVFICIAMVSKFSEGNEGCHQQCHAVAGTNTFKCDCIFMLITYLYFCIFGFLDFMTEEFGFLDFMT